MICIGEPLKPKPIKRRLQLPCFRGIRWAEEHLEMVPPKATAQFCDPSKDIVDPFLPSEMRKDRCRDNADVQMSIGRPQRLLSKANGLFSIVVNKGCHRKIRVMRIEFESPNIAQSRPLLLTQGSNVL